MLVNFESDKVTMGMHSSCVCSLCALIQWSIPLAITMCIKVAICTIYANTMDPLHERSEVR